MFSTKTLWIVLGVAALVQVYFLGYYQGMREEKRNELKFGIGYGVHVYKIAERGDSVKGALGIQVLGKTRTYQSLFGNEAVDPAFEKQLREAEQISDRVEASLVPPEKMIEEINRALDEQSKKPADH
jgi:hypothetical protein